jgi:hypothetical protein
MDGDHCDIFRSHPTPYISKAKMLDHTMFKETFARLGTGLNKIAKAIRAKIGVAICQCMPSPPAYAGIKENIVVTGSTNALNAGKRYRLTSGHAPVFSLFTFFGHRS